MNELIPLQSCHITQHTSGSAVTSWSIEANETNDKLGDLPKHLSEAEVFAIIAFARKYELEALNIGIEFQKDKNNECLQAQIDGLKNMVSDLSNENEKLADALENITKG